MNTTIINTCTEVMEGQPFMDMVFGIIKTQWLPFLIVFIGVPFIVMLLFQFKISNNKKIYKSDVREKMFFMALLIFIMQVILYLVLVSAKFTFVQDILNSLR